MNVLPVLVKTRFLRIIPISKSYSSTARCLRAEVYGCHPGMFFLSFLDFSNRLIKKNLFLMGRILKSFQHLDTIKIMGAASRFWGWKVEGKLIHESWIIRLLEPEMRL